MTTIPTLNLIGSGHAACTLARLWHDSGCLEIQDILTRSVSTAEAGCHFIGAGRAVRLLNEMRPADYWLIGVPDDALAGLVAGLVASQAIRAGDGVFHLSGFTSSSVFVVLAGGGARIASLHPALSFADPATAIEQFTGTMCGLEGEESLCAELQAHVAAIGGECFAINPNAKPLYHAGAVFASNFLVVLVDLAQQAYLEAGISSDTADKLIAHLTRKTLENVLTHGPAASITGPAARGDVDTISQQYRTLTAWNLSAGQTYAILSELATELAQRPHAPR